MSARPPRPTRSVDRARAQIAPVRTGDGWRAIAPLMGPPPAKPETGPAPRLEWIEVGKLVVEESYQREIGERGLKNIGEIVRNFRWSRFTPVIVAPREDGLYALIDGQHRATAAATLRIGEVPAQIVDMGPEERTEAFSYINGAVTALSAMATFHAAVAARIQAAVAAQRALDAAGARVLRYPLAAGRMAPGDTCAAGALMKAADTYGDAALSAALVAIPLIPPFAEWVAHIDGAKVDADISVDAGDFVEVLRHFISFGVALYVVERLLELLKTLRFGSPFVKENAVRFRNVGVALLVGERFAADGSEPVGSGAEEFAAYIREAIERIAEAMETVARQAGVAAADIDWFVPHQANERIILGVVKKLDLRPDQVISTIAGQGNTSAASIPLAYHQGVADGRIKLGDLVMLEGMGGGLTWGAALLRA